MNPRHIREFRAAGPLGDLHSGVVGSAVYGALQAVEIIVIVFGAVLLMNHRNESGAVAAIRVHFTAITEDRRVQ